MVKTVVIAGSGPAGLSCAYRLLKDNKKIKVIILEKDSQVGGISKTVNYNNNRIDIGGHRFFTKNKEVKKFWFDILPLQGKGAKDDIILNTKKDFASKGPNPEKKDEVMLVRNRISRIYYKRKFFDYPVNFNFKTIKNMGFITTVICGFSYIKSCIFKKKETNLENFYINRFGKKLYSIFFKDYTTKLWGRSPSDIDSSWGSQRVKGLSIKKVLVDFFMRLFRIKNNNKETSLIESFYYPKFGPGQFYESLLNKIKDMGGKIIYNAEVIKVNNSSNSISSITYLKNGKKVELACDEFISSIPVKDLVNSMKRVPVEVKNIANNLPYRDFVTVGVLVNKLCINDKINKTIHGSLADNWIYVQDSSVSVGRIQIFNNWSPYMVDDPIKTIWIGLEYFCSEYDDFWNKTDDELKELANKELKKMKFIDSDVIDSCVIRIKKAYPAYFDSYYDIDKVKNYLNKFNNLYCIGRNGTHSYNNMDHSIISGFLCSDMITNGDNDHSKLWDVNVDKSYQE